MAKKTEETPRTYTMTFEDGKTVKKTVEDPENPEDEQDVEDDPEKNRRLSGKSGR